MSESDLVRVEHDGHVTTVTINRPDKLNALAPDVVDALAEAIETIEEREETRAVILTGEGKAFVAGADIAAMMKMSSAESTAFGTKGHNLMRSIEELAVPVIAAVNGFALGGGCELALACDFIHVSEKAKLGLPEVGLGIIPGFGGTQRLPRRVGPGVARELIYTGKMIDAREASRIGLANAVHAPDELLSAVRSVAEEIAKKGPKAVAAAKAAMLEGLDKPLSHACRLEIEAFGDLFGSEDQREGMQAFLEKREAKFKGR